MTRWTRSQEAVVGTLSPTALAHFLARQLRIDPVSARARVRRRIYHASCHTADFGLDHHPDTVPVSYRPAASRGGPAQAASASGTAAATATAAEACTAAATATAAASRSAA